MKKIFCLIIVSLIGGGLAFFFANQLSEAIVIGVSCALCYGIGGFAFN